MIKTLSFVEAVDGETPMSSLNAFAMMNQYGITEVGYVEEYACTDFLNRGAIEG